MDLPTILPITEFHWYTNSIIQPSPPPRMEANVRNRSPTPSCISVELRFTERPSLPCQVRPVTVPSGATKKSSLERFLSTGAAPMKRTRNCISTASCSGDKYLQPLLTEATSASCLMGIAARAACQQSRLDRESFMMTGSGSPGNTWRNRACVISLRGPKSAVTSQDAAVGSMALKKQAHLKSCSCPAS
eukprot:jgi/Botrbrau1/11632/Bobra.0209s0022.1